MMYFYFQVPEGFEDVDCTIDAQMDCDWADEGEVEMVKEAL